jgi:predicted transcriptional regulator
MVNYLRGIDLISVPFQKKYRSYIEIVVLILEAVKFGDASLYSVMKQTSINYPQLKKYLNPLSMLDLVEVNVKGGKVYYRATEKGLAFLKQYSILREMLSEADFETNNIQCYLQKIK